MLSKFIFLDFLCDRFPKPSVVNLPPVSGDRISKEIEFIYELIVALGMGSDYYGTLPPENEEQVSINFVSACAPTFHYLAIFAFKFASSMALVVVVLVVTLFNILYRPQTEKFPTRCCLTFSMFAAGIEGLTPDDCPMFAARSMASGLYASLLDWTNKAGIVKLQIEETIARVAALNHSCVNFTA